ncbi:MAG TPA: diguanylate cyclase [Stellaceae bacterium]|nr:diguanylate cyclase [Stellaceae bacterium]
MMAPRAAASRGGYSLKARFYALIGLLAVLPICGASVDVIALQRSTQDNTALDRATRSLIRLERTSGLVNAVVMESRGIYMSADRNAAEKFAQNLTADLAALHEAAQDGKAEAAASQRLDAAELWRRINQFDLFGGELVRLAREDGPTAARTFGDNAANRDLQTALDRSLARLALAYQQEALRARADDETDDWNFTVVTGALAAIAIIVLGGGVVFVRKALLAPLLTLKDQMLRLAEGNLVSPNDPPQHATEIADMARAVEVFRSELIDRQRLNRETNLLSSLNDWLQSCNSLSELYNIMSTFLGRVLATSAGSLFVYANSRDILECAKVWNGARMMPAMRPDDCWGLRRGRTYTFGDSEFDFPCAHVGASDPRPYCCIPILAHGETIGLLHFEFQPEDEATSRTLGPGEIAEQRRLGIVCAEQISLAIANIKLRDQLRDQSIRDPLTGMFNRRYLLETCRREFARAARTQQSVGVLSIDIDHFKTYNDSHGHDAGDVVLRAVGGCLATLFRTEDVPCRFGGEEFVVILPGANLEAAARRAEHLRGQVAALIVRYRNKDLPSITISIGVAAFPEAGDTPETVLRVADEALYRAKANGRNRVETAVTAGGEPAEEQTIAVEGAPEATFAAAAED